MEKSETSKREEEVLAFWKERHIFEKTVEKDAPQGEFVFYDGPPFATGLPHMGHFLSSTIKDAIPRYKTMRGFRVHRRWGWDCHGLPIENLVEKKLGLKSKKEIEEMGIDVFNEVARDSVLQFERDWEKYVDRIGRFVDFWNSYKTMDNSYIEAVWWALKQLHEKGLLYEGFKVLMYCPKDETPLAKAEIAADNTYKDLTEEAVTVKFRVIDPQSHGLPDNTYLLAWTTTPWTLPGNVALAVGKDIEYALIKSESGGHVLLADALKPEGVRAIQKMPGKNLIGMSYEPLFDVSAIRSDKSYKLYAADFVNTSEGTGIVHTAVMYGEDDFELGKREGLPMVQMLDAAAHYNDQAPLFIRGRYIRAAQKDIVADLESRGLLFAKAPHTHSYPHCWRCGTPLIYNAVSSWFVDIQKIKTRLLEENNGITWVPEHLKHGRFANIVENAPDWTISRNRFWASPLPIWKSAGGNVMIVGSLGELTRRVKKSGNRYLVMRHGEAEHMVRHIVSDDPKREYALTENGRQQALESAARIPRDKPIVIIASPTLRAQQTAGIVARELDIPESQIITDDRLREMGFGSYEGKPMSEFLEGRETPEWYTARVGGGESLEDVKIRAGQAIYEYEAAYRDSTVLMVGHAATYEALLPVCEGARGDRLIDVVRGAAIGTAELIEIPFVPLPVNKKFELDLHRPYTDGIVLLDDEGREYRRIPEVVDCWIESGSMPFASYADVRGLSADFDADAKPATLLPKIPFPADFIAEYIAQTRTWFYYLHAIGVALFDHAAFRTVVSTGTILAADGAKMSKSKGNYTDPLELMDRFGADAVRFYLMSSVVMQSEDLNFRDEDVREAHNRAIGILWNSYKFFELYKHEYDGMTQSADSPHALDRWIRSRLGVALREATDAMERYDMPAASRSVKSFVEDYSTWYVRRSRDRVRGGSDPTDKQFCLATQREVLTTFAKIIAPIMPFIAESMYQGIEGHRMSRAISTSDVNQSSFKESVHLENWPEEIGVDSELLLSMEKIRAAASAGLKLRDEAKIKVRQPLALLRVRDLPEDPELVQILADEVNVKRVECEESLADEAWLDTELSEELVLEGQLRDVIRAIQDARKREGLSVNDRPTLKVTADAEGTKFFEQFKKEIVSQTGLADLEVKEGKTEEGEKGLPFKVQFFFN